ncbi:dihydrolipoyl dehydrogenase [bacterium]|nr:dihydrolipoyl dehydrogenase [bacterium]
MADRKLVIVGGGPAGYVAAIHAAQNGVLPTLIENGNLGGVCTNQGCIPTKTYITAANHLNHIKNSPKWGIRVDGYSTDFSSILSNKNRVVSRVARGIEFLLKKNKVEYISGRALFKTPRSLEVKTSEGKEDISFEKLIIATGSKARYLPIPGLDSEGIWTSTEALDASETPKSLLIIGGGVIGVEMAYIFSTFGSKVTIVEILPEILPGFDPEIASTLRKDLEKLGVNIRLQTTVKSIMEAQSGFTAAIENEEHQYEKVLLAVGRIPYDREALENIGLEFENNWVKIDQFLNTNYPHIWAAGDIVGAPWLAHKASYDGEVAVNNALGKKTAADYWAVPSAIFSSLEIGTVGLTAEEARKEGYEISEGKFPYIASGRAQAAGETNGFIKVVLNRKNEEIIGIHLIGKEATELLGSASLIVRNKFKVSQVADTIFAHPTLSEMIREASLSTVNKAVHI